MVSPRLFQLACAVLILSPVLRVEAQPAEEGPKFLPRDQAIQQLREAAAVYTRNLDKLETWSGRARVTKTRADPPGKGEVHEVEFYWSRKLGTRWRWKPVAQFDVRAGEKSPPARQFVFDGMIIGDVWYEIMNHGGHDENDRTLVIKDVQSGSRNDVHAFDPIWRMNLSWHPPSVQLETLANSIAKGSQSQVQFNNGRVTILSTSQWAFNQLNYDLNRGGAFTLFVSQSVRTPENPKGIPICKKSSDWEQIEDVWLPKSVSSSAVDQRVELTVVEGNVVVERIEGKTRTSTEVIEFFKHRVNEPISPDEFTVERMGLKPGHTIVNRINDTVSKYQGGEIDLAPETKEP